MDFSSGGIFTFSSITLLKLRYKIMRIRRFPPDPAHYCERHPSTIAFYIAPGKKFYCEECRPIAVELCRRDAIAREARSAVTSYDERLMWAQEQDMLGRRAR